MRHDLDACRGLAEAILSAYQGAIKQERLEVADKVLCALEALAQSVPACNATLERAYLSSCAPKAEAEVGCSARPEVLPP